LSNCLATLQSCAAKIATIKRNRTAPTSTEIEQYPRSYRREGEDTPSCGRFRVLAHPSIGVPVVKMPLPATDTIFAGWGSSIVNPYGRALPARRLRKEESDRAWKGRPSTEKPKAGQRWFLSEDAERIIAESESTQREILDYYTEQLEQLSKEFGTRPARTARKIVRLVHDPADVEPRPIISTKRFRDPSAFVRKRLEQLFASKKDVPRANVDELADVLSWQARGLSAREIAEQLGQTQAWVRWRLDGISRIFIRNGITNLSTAARLRALRAQQKMDAVTG
jgi:hypothetical protein